MTQQPLQVLLQQLLAILKSIPILELQGYKPPIIDGDGHGRNGDPILGLRIFKDAVCREVEILEQFLARPDHGTDLSTNAPYFVAVWNEILSAPPPIVAVGKIFEPPHSKYKYASAGGGKPGGIKIDVVADEGRKWIRVNTMKNSRILAEFREFDSYLTGSEDESDNDAPFKQPAEQDNTLIRMGRNILSASAVPIPGTNDRPSVTLRLTRLQPDGNTDPRIAQTIHSLTNMGIHVELGQRAFRSLHDDPVALESSSRSPVQFQPTSRINVDLSMLIALVSDLSHAELPRSEEEALTRFRMPINARSWKLGKGSMGDASPRQTDSSQENEDLSKHSRALSTQCIQEMEHGLVEEVVQRLKTVSLHGDLAPEFWTTEEARDRCLQIVEKIGGEDERRRARALFPATATAANLPHCREEFWRGSRYPSSYFPSFLPIHIHHPYPHDDIPRHSTSLFWGHLIQTCRYILSHDAAPHPKLYRKDGEMERAKVTKVNPKLTVHTVESMLVGACEGMTTLTANKASVKGVLREMKGVKHGRGDVVSVGIQTRSGDCDGEEDAEEDCENSVAAAIWIVEPRSLAEGMRADRLSAA